MKTLVNWYNKNILPNRVSFRQTYVQLMNNADSDKDRAHLLLIGAPSWPRDCHQWYLKMKMVVYHQMIIEITDKRLWEIPLSQFETFEDLYKSLEQWMNRPYIRQLTIYDVATRIVIAREEYRLLPKDYVYLHAKPRAAYAQLLDRGFVSFKPKGWNVIIPKNKLPEFVSMDSYSIEDLLCEIGKDRITMNSIHKETTSSAKINKEHICGK